LEKKIALNQLFFIFLYCFNMLISKINLKKYKNILFCCIPNKKYFEKQSVSQFQTGSNLI